jgi:hypothetical protein
MQNAPSVIYPLGHSVFYSRALVLLGAVSVALIALGWWISWMNSPWTTAHGLWASGLLVWALWAVLTWRRLPLAPAGALHWSTQAAPADLNSHAGAWVWRWDDPVRVPVPVRVVPVLDLQERLLLRIHGLPAVGRWMWFERRACPQHWDDFRRALTAHARQA